MRRQRDGEQRAGWSVQRGKDQRRARREIVSVGRSEGLFHKEEGEGSACSPLAHPLVLIPPRSYTHHILQLVASRYGSRKRPASPRFRHPKYFYRRW